MDKLRKFASLPSADQRRFFVALPVVVAVRVALWVLPFGKLQAAITRPVRRRSGAVAPSMTDAERIAWSVGSAARFVPKATCLTQALAGSLLLSRAGHPAEVRIGVAKDPAGKLEAHAWVESRGRVLIGDHDLHRFTTLGPADDAT